jgi:magnesium chelatase family protein
LCGYRGDTLRACTCSEQQVRKYQQRISGPMLDRFDIQLDVQRVDYDKLTDERHGEPSDVIQGRVEVARERQRTRYKDLPGILSKLQLSARAYHRVLKVSRTIADLAGSDTIRTEHVAEAVQYRSRTLLA